MKKLLILVLVSFIFVQSVSAEVWLIVHKHSKEILSLSPEPDAQLPNNEYVEIVLPLEFKEIELQAHPTFYKFKDGKFILNIEKISDEALALEELTKKRQRRLKIQTKLEELAVKEIQKEEPTFK